MVIVVSDRALSREDAIYLGPQLRLKKSSRDPITCLVVVHPLNCCTVRTVVTLKGGNGEGTLWYPGRPDKIGGDTHIPVASLRLKLIREGQEDYEYLRLAERLVGRDVVIKTMSNVMVTATNFTNDPLDIYAVRMALAALIEQVEVE
jgi:hypothetical protein